MPAIRIAATDHEDHAAGWDETRDREGLAHQGGIRRPPHRRL